MNFLFHFALRLFLAFLTAKFFLSLLGGGSPALLLILALSLTGLSYGLAWLNRRYRLTWHRQAAALGWRLARFLISLNLLQDPRSRQRKKDS